MERLSRSLVGEVRCLEVLKNFQEFTTVEGLNDVKVRYFGGLAVLIEFRTNLAAKNYLFLARCTWSKWFRKLDCWTPEAQPMKRLASLNIVGVPPQAWLTNVFSDIGSNWGEVVLPEWCNEDSQNRERGNVTILTQNFNIINDTVDLIIENTSFKIMIVEDFKDTENIHPKFLHNTAEHANNDEENKIYSDRSLYDENSEFSFDGDNNEYDQEDDPALNLEDDPALNLEGNGTLFHDDESGSPDPTANDANGKKQIAYVEGGSPDQAANGANGKKT
ncbi:hypothetical protein LXL04_008101 [Taraxacum kok-saghyz]